MRKLRSGVITVLIVFPIYSISQSAGIPEAEFIPAQFSDSPRSLQNRIEFPDVNGDIDVTVRCVTKIGESGSMGEPSCIADESGNENVFLQEVVRSSRTSEVSPARVNGSAVQVNIFPYMVMFKRDGDNETISVLPNHGRNEQLYGQDYIAAQRYGIVIGPRCGSYRIDPNAFRVFYISDVAEIDGDIEFAGDRSARVTRCDEEREIVIRRSNYIPAHFQGKPVGSVVVQWVP